MKNEINYSELFKLANSRASDIIRRDKTPVRFTIDPVTRGKVMIPKPRTITRSEALRQAFREMYAKYTVVVSVSAQEQLQRETSRRERDEIANFYSHPVWNRGGQTND
jgi:hypothetical protein